MERLRMTHRDRNPKWRLGDIVFMENCGECGTKIEWQGQTLDDNNVNNFHKYIYDLGWRRRSVGLFGLGGKEWICNLHK